MTASGIRVGWLAVLLLSLTACRHTVGFHPVKEPSLGERVPTSASLVIDPSIPPAEHSFRAFGSGIANSWTVPYGQRVHDFAQVYLAGTFQEFSESESLETAPGDVRVHITRAEYTVKGQAAHVDLDVTALDASGRELFSKTYASRGWSGGGAVFGGGAFAQKGVTRSSTDQALNEVFLDVVADLREALGAPPLPTTSPETAPGT